MLTLNVRPAVHEALIRLLGELDDDPEAVADDAQLFELGLNSLHLARLIINLETATGVDPFADGGISGVRTVGDLVTSYERALSAAGRH